MNIEKIKNLLLEKENRIGDNDIDEKEKIMLIKNILETKNCFFNIDMKLSIDILYFLGIPKDSLLDTYYELISPKNYEKEKTFELVDLNNIIK